MAERQASGTCIGSITPQAGGSYLVCAGLFGALGGAAGGGSGCVPLKAF